MPVHSLFTFSGRGKRQSGPRRKRPGVVLRLEEFETRLTPTTGGFSITPTFDPTITGSANADAIKNTINAAIAYYQNTFSNPINFRPIRPGCRARSGAARAGRVWQRQSDSGDRCRTGRDTGPECDRLYAGHASGKPGHYQREQRDVHGRPNEHLPGDGHRLPHPHDYPGGLARRPAGWADIYGQSERHRIETDGSYSVSGVATGEARVAVNSPNPKSISLTYKNPNKKPEPYPDVKGWFLVPKQYEKPSTSGLIYAIKRGENTIDIELK